ncbi:ABC transporter permease [Suttonella ornithocola]|uniref:Inner membrane transport permease ybhR n=1 Tax=Suttonella ornithocola TaxID=279832 RepID=A0A380MT10_9GAMM|nr:ABC transporter permease [Suttonella ornithocola]SUO95324.1 Inner membrane transport permease ybhR [Suttonella ornithocola]
MKTIQSSSSQSSFPHRFWRSFLGTIKAVFTDMGVLLIMVLAPLIYGAYYPWAYSNQIVRHIPIAIVDHDHSTLSRQIIRFVDAVPSVEIQVLPSEREARQALLTNEIMAFMVIPANLQQHLSQGQENVVNMVGNGSYILASKYAQQGIAEAVGTVSAGIELKQLAASGIGREMANAIRDPVPLKINPLHNPNEGYGSYVVPAVAWLILQQTLLIGCAMLIGTWIERGSAHVSMRIWFARIVALSLIHWFICLGYTGWLFTLWRYSHGGNPLGNLLLIGIFSPCVAILGCLIGLVVADRERAMQVLIFSSLPIYFVSGFSWPVQQLPPILQGIRWLFPSTSAINAGVNFNQLNAPIRDNIQYLLVLAIITMIGFLLVCWRGRPSKQ